jgi:phosphoribosylanthranilate isomerase
MLEKPVTRSPQIKICGLTTVEEALASADLGANAIGLVFYPPSPRFVTDAQAAVICRALPPTVCSVGVFVNHPLEEVLDKVLHCGLRAVQLHGQESPVMVQTLRDRGVIVIKALFANGQPAFARARDYSAQGFLAECVGERLPGGNGQAWNWSTARALAREVPVILAGGLTPDNVGQSIDAARPAAVDVSSGVEAQPGRKDLTKVRRFLEAVRSTGGYPLVGKVFP